jgi:wobble nucleotide-excising tRNase
MTSKASADVKESKEVIAGYKKEIEQLEKEKAQALEEIDQRWGEVASQVSEISVVPLKKDVLLDLFGVAWFPYYLVQMGEETVELPGYGVSG